jgi:diguanylate cyclase (GGDEF)-like protein/PAS domain S-box-containing protein
MISHRDAAQQLALNNKLMELKLDEITNLRSLADEQSRKSLSLAEGMAEARLSTEKLMHQLQDDKKLVSSILNAVQDGIITIDSYGVIETFNLGAEQIFGYKAIEVVNKNVSKLMPEPLSIEHDGYLLRYRNGQSTRDQTLPLEAVALRKNGDSFPVEVTLNPIEIDNQIKIMGVIRDITERKNQQEKIRLLAMTDPLTGLANRHKYNESLDKAVKQALRFKTQFALLFIDLDKFKPVNDTYGHPVGDALLKHVAKELTASCRDVDLVARLGGDEFALLAIGINEQQEVSILAERIIKAISNPVTMGPHTLQIGASIGISYFPQDSSDIEALSRMADEALYIAKQEGRNTYRYYSELET